jgi:hypothetical protein
MGVSCSRSSATTESVVAQNSHGNRQLPLSRQQQAARVPSTDDSDGGELSVTASGWCAADDVASLGAMLKESFGPSQMHQLAGSAPSSPEFETLMYRWHPQKREDDDDEDDERFSPGPASGSQFQGSPAPTNGVIDTAPFLILQRALLSSTLTHRMGVQGHSMAASAPVVDYSKEAKALRKGGLLSISQKHFVSNERRARLLGLGKVCAADMLSLIGHFSANISLMLYGLVETCALAVSKHFSAQLGRRRGGGGEDLLKGVSTAAAAWLDRHTSALCGKINVLFSAPGAKVAPVTAAATVGFKLLLALGGGVPSLLADDQRLVFTADGQAVCSNDDGELQAALIVDALNHIVSLSKLAGFDGYSGMHTIEAAEEWISVMREMFVVCGALPPQLSTRCRPQCTLLEWINLLPVFALSESSMQGLTYLYAVVAGQQRVVLQPIMRASVLAHVAQALQTNPATRELHRYTMGADGSKFTPPSSHKAFPLFATEGIGLESGEGHGPRKELFDSIGVDLTATRGPAMDLTSAVSVTILSGLKELSSTRIANGQVASAVGGAVCLLTWRQSKLVRRFNQGDTLTATMALQPAGRPSIHGSSQPSPNAVSECWEVQKEIEAVAPNETILLLVAPTRLPQGYRLQSLLAFQKREPLFVHENAEQHAWFNPSLSDRNEALPGQLWAAGWALANAIPNGLMLSAPLPPLLFYFLRLFDISEMSFPSDVRHAIVERMDLNMLNLLKPSLSAQAKQVQDLSLGDFAELVGAEGMDPRSTSRAQYIQETIVKGSVFCCDGSPDTTMKHIESFCRGYFSSSAAACPALLFSGSTKRLLRYLCAPVDDGSQDFSFQEHFRLVEAAEFTQFPHSRVFRELFFQSLEDHDAPMKRQLLKFITGRVLLPHQPKAEHIKVEFPFSPMSAKEFDAALARLPSSHSCDNVLEMPDYLECLLFGSQSPFYGLCGKPVNSVILDDAKEKVWGLLSSDQRRMMSARALDIMRTKLVAAVEMSGTYELDDGAIRADVREAFERQTRPTSAADVGGKHSLPRLASSVGSSVIDRPASPPISPVRERTPSFFSRQQQSPRPGSHRGPLVGGVTPGRSSASMRLHHKITADSDDEDIGDKHSSSNAYQFDTSSSSTFVLGHNRSHHSLVPAPDASPSGRGARPAAVTSSQRLSVFSKQNDVMEFDDDVEILDEPPSASAAAASQQSKEEWSPSRGGLEERRQPAPPPPMSQKRAADIDDLESELFGGK